MPLSLRLQGEGLRKLLLLCSLPHSPMECVVVVVFTASLTHGVCCCCCCCVHCLTHPWSVLLLLCSLPHSPMECVVVVVFTASLTHGVCCCCCVHCLTHPWSVSPHQALCQRRAAEQPEPRSTPTTQEPQYSGSLTPERDM